MIMESIEAHEKCFIALFDFPGLFLNADMYEVVNMRLLSKLADMMVMVAPRIYRLFLTYGKNGEAIMYVTLKKAM